MQKNNRIFLDWFHNQLMNAKLGLASSCAFISILGYNYTKNFSFRHIFSSVKVGVFYLLVFLGLFILFNYIFQYIFKFFQWSTRNLSVNPDKKFLLKIVKILQSENFVIYFIILIICWLPLILISYPGGTCIDINYQILQGLGVEEYSTWQPLFHTLLINGYIKIGALILNSYNLGLFLFILFQCILLTTILAHSIQLLVRKKVKPQVIAIILAIYCFVPIYPNFATMAIKDTLFAAFFLLYILYFLELCEAITMQSGIKKKTFIYLFVAGLCMCLMRNNGIYSIIISFIIILAVSVKNKISLIKSIFIYTLIIASYLLILNTLKTTLQAKDLGAREILSIPMQQTARYCVEYENEISEEEWIILGNVFEEPRELKNIYDPNISDPVKSTFLVSADNSSLFAYFKLYSKHLIKHPGVYIDAFLNHSYGWFYLGADNAIRHEGKLSIFTNTLLSVNSDYTVTTIYGVLHKFPPYFILQNIGFYVWFLFSLMLYLKGNGQKYLFLLFSPMLVSILICIASPAFYLNARYALPIVFSSPYYYGYFMTKIKK